MQIYELVDSNSSTMKRQRFRGSPYENIDEACYKWLVNARGQSIPIQPRCSKRKPSTLQTNWDTMISAHQRVGWADGRKENNVYFKTISGLFRYVFSVLEIRYLQIPTVL